VILASELKWITEDGSQAGPAVRAIAPGRFKEHYHGSWPAYWRGRHRRGRSVAELQTAGTKPCIFLLHSRFPAHDIAIAPNGHTLAVVSYHESARKNVVWICELGSQSADTSPIPRRHLFILVAG